MSAAEILREIEKQKFTEPSPIQVIFVEIDFEVNIQYLDERICGPKIISSLKLQSQSCVVLGLFFCDVDKIR